MHVQQGESPTTTTTIMSDEADVDDQLARAKDLREKGLITPEVHRMLQMVALGLDPGISASPQGPAERPFRQDVTCRFLPGQRSKSSLK